MLAMPLFERHVALGAAICNGRLVTIQGLTDMVKFSVMEFAAIATPYGFVCELLS